jgi:hypothetical protein
MPVMNDALLHHPTAQQLVQRLKHQGYEAHLAIRLKHQGYEAHLAIRQGYLTLTIRLCAVHTSDTEQATRSPSESEPLSRKKKYLRSLLGSRRAFDDTDFLQPAS